MCTEYNDHRVSWETFAQVWDESADRLDALNAVIEAGGIALDGGEDYWRRRHELLEAGRQLRIRQEGEDPNEAESDATDAVAPLYARLTFADTYALGYQWCAWCSGRQAGPGLPIEHQRTCTQHPEYDDAMHERVMQKRLERCGRGA